MIYMVISMARFEGQGLGEGGGGASPSLNLKGCVVVWIGCAQLAGLRAYICSYDEYKLS